MRPVGSAEWSPDPGLGLVQVLGGGLDGVPWVTEWRRVGQVEIADLVHALGGSPPPVCSQVDAELQAREISALLRTTKGFSREG